MVPIDVMLLSSVKVAFGFTVSVRVENIVNGDWIFSAAGPGGTVLATA
jgi:hypothetical protein